MKLLLAPRAARTAPRRARGRARSTSRSSAAASPVCACALTLARGGRSVRVHEAREIACGASGRNGGFALRGGAMRVRRRPRVDGRRRARASLWRWTEDALDAHARARRRRVRAASAACAWPRTRRSGTRSGASTTRSSRTGSRPSGGTSSRAARGAVPGCASSTPATPRCSLRDGCDGWPRSPRRRAPTSASTTGWTSLDALDADRVVVATDGYPSGLLRRARGARSCPTRGQMLATEPLAERVFACPHYGRHGFDYWQQTPGRPRPRRRLPRLRARHRVHGRRDDDRADPGGARAVRRGRGRATGRGRAPLGRHLRARPRLPPGRRPASPATTASGSPAATPGHGNVLGFACGEAVGRALLGEDEPMLDLFRPGPPARRRGVSVERHVVPGLFPPPDYAHVAIAQGRLVLTAGGVPLDADGHPRRPRATTASRPGA